jgi:hypothetical protein
MSFGGDKSNGELKSNGLKAGPPLLQPGPSAVKPRPPAAQPGPPAAQVGPPEAQLEEEGSGAEKGIARLKRLFDAHIFPGTFFTSFRPRSVSAPHPMVRRSKERGEA